MSDADRESGVGAPDDAGTVLASRHGNVLCLTLSYPARRNAVSLQMRGALDDALQAAQADAQCRAVVLTGAGNHFCSGGDISGFGGVTAAGGRARMQDLHRIIRAMVGGRTPLVAAVEGAALGAGLGLAAACDVVVASATARFAAPYGRFGLVPDYGILWTLPARIGVGRTRMLAMTGRTIGAEEAERIGLVDQVVPPGTAAQTALAVAADIAEGAPLAHELLKAILSRGPDSLEAVLAAEADAQGVLYATQDYTEALSAYSERRSPDFQGR